MSNSPSDAQKRAARMAAFSAKVKDEEDQGVAVRSFNEAKEGSSGTKTFDPKTGQVRSGSAGGAAPAPKANVKTVSDDELFAEIDAAVAAEEKKSGKTVTLPSTPAPEPAAPKPATAPSFSAKRLAAMANFSIDKPESRPATSPGEAAAAQLSDLGEVEVSKPAIGKAKPLETTEATFELNAPTPKPAPRMASAKDEEFTLEARKPSARASAIDAEAGDVQVNAPKPHHIPVGHGKSGAGEFSVQKDAAPASAPAKIRSPSEDEFTVKLDAEAKDVEGIVAPADTEYAVKSDAQSKDLAASADQKVQDVLGQTPIELPHKMSKPAPAPLPKSPAEMRRDAERRTVAPLPDFGAQRPNVRRDAEPKHLPKMHSAGDDAVDARRDAAPKALPKMHSAGDDAVNARHDAAPKAMPRLQNPADAKVDARRDANEPKHLPKMANAADRESFVARLDKEAREDRPRMLNPSETGTLDARQDRQHGKPIGAIRSPADTMRPDVHMDRQAARESPRLRSPGDVGGFEAKLDKESRGGIGRIRSPADSAFETKQDAQAKALPRMRNAADADSFETHQDAQAKALPRMRNAADADSFETHRDAQAKALPRMRNAADADAYETKQDAQAKVLPRMRNAADADAYETHQDAQAKQLPRMRNAADADTYEAKLAWQQKKVTGIRSAADAEAYETQLDREDRDAPDLHNPGQTEFEVKMEHESVWTTPVRRDIDAESIAGKKGKSAK